MIQELLSTRPATGALGPESFAPCRAVTEAGHARSFEDTWAWVSGLLRRVPISRIVNATPLDFVGLPVWSAITPLAKDLMVHAGKGRTSLASRLSAVMEAIERVSGEAVAPARLYRASFASLGAERSVPAVDPRIFDLPFDTTYHDHARISWVQGWDLIAGEHAWVPLDLAISPAEEGVCVGVETNGLASGNTITEATLHALYEVIERDAVSDAQFADRFAEPTDRLVPPPRMIDPATLPADTRGWLDQLAGHGISAYVRDLTNDVAVPVFEVILEDPSFAGTPGSSAQFAGYGADLAPARAVFRAVTEAVQAHTIVTLGARDTFEGTRPIPDRGGMLRRRLDVLHPPVLHAFEPGGDAPSGDLRVDLDRVLERLRGVGCARCIVIDLTREDLRVPVVRVLVPGLSSPYGSSRRRPGARLLRRISP